MKNSSKRLKVIQPEKFIICKKILTLVLLINIQACYSAAVIDDFVENSLDKNLQIKPYTPSIINDEFAESNKKYSRIKPYEKLKPVDEELPKTVNKPLRRKEFILEENRTPIQICIKEIYSSKKKLEEGSFLEFKTLSDVKARKQEGDHYYLAYINQYGALIKMGDRMSFVEALAMLGITGATNNLSNTYQYNREYSSDAH